MFEPEVFRKQIYCIKENTCDIFGTFRCSPQSIGPRGIVPPSLRPCRWPTANCFIRIWNAQWKHGRNCLVIQRQTK